MSQTDGLNAEHNKARSISLSGLAIAISLLCLMLFRGVLSIIQALIIPVVLVMLTVRQTWPYRAATGISLIALTLIFFPVQFVFVLIYFIMAVLLQRIYLHSNQKSLRRWVYYIFYFFFIGLMLYTGIILTDIILGTHLNAMMHQLSRGNNMIYFMIILLEALIISVIHLVSLLLSRQRVSKIHKITRR